MFLNGHSRKNISKFEFKMGNPRSFLYYNKKQSVFVSCKNQFFEASSFNILNISKSTLFKIYIIKNFFVWPTKTNKKLSILSVQSAIKISFKFLLTLRTV